MRGEAYRSHPYDDVSSSKSRGTSGHQGYQRAGLYTDAEPPRRVLLYSGSYNHITDGVTLTLNRLVAFLERIGTEVLVVAPTTRQPELIHHGTLAPAPSLPVPGRGEYRMATIIPPSLRSRITSFQPELIHVATPDLPGRWTMSYARRHAIPVVSTYHTDFLSYLRYYHLEKLESMLLRYLRYFYRRCDLVCVPTRSMARELEQRGVEGRMRIWGRGVDLDRFSPSHRSLRWRRDLGVADGVPIITYVGRVVAEKNVHLIPEVSRRLRKLRIPHQMLVVGDGPEREELQKNLPNGIFTGRLEGNELSRAYASSDLFFFPSTTETFGNVILEAMASGLPAVCAEATGSNDLVRHERSGYLAPISDVDTIVRYLRGLIIDEELRATMRSEAIASANGQSWDAILQRMVDYYNEARALVPEQPGLRRVFGLAPLRD